ncbi:TrmB family transcriptional regulator [Halomicroarcula sp. F13]|uniref:TrmB family transcriptional regulator n=1 Tax=Haloarcula rubra TaxID=2487747 RepID=A0AAW4PY30_9EURY|nr:TrmB family transcriptional regulator [Halomicroarcula rubra]MBX0325147.1 TrmB family transcriptional regulator [Halomicroarcula rubra]
MDTETLRTTLEDIGLTQYEADAYVTVLEVGSASATEIADASDVPQARIYDVLRNLEGSGYVETYEKGSLHARARDPEEVIEQLDAYADTVTEAGSELRERWEKPTVENHQVSIIRPVSTIYDRAAEQIDDAENEIEVALTPAQFREFRESLAAAVGRGVVVKATLSGVEELPDLDFDGAVTEVRHRRLPTPFLLLADRMSVSFTPEETLHPRQEYGLLVNDYSLSRMFDWYFQTAFWEPWPQVFDAREDTLPRTFTNIRECIRDIRPLIDEGCEVVMTVHGQVRGEGVERQFTGRVDDITYTAGEDGPALATFTDEATVTLETPDETYTVGGWGAMLEDIEARRFVVETVD